MLKCRDYNFFFFSKHSCYLELELIRENLQVRRGILRIVGNFQVSPSEVHVTHLREMNGETAAGVQVQSKRFLMNEGFFQVLTAIITIPRAMDYEFTIALDLKRN